MKLHSIKNGKSVHNPLRCSFPFFFSLPFFLPFFHPLFPFVIGRTNVKRITMKYWSDFWSSFFTRDSSRGWVRSIRKITRSTRSTTTDDWARLRQRGHVPVVALVSLRTSQSTGDRSHGQRSSFNIVTFFYWIQETNSFEQFNISGFPDINMCIFEKTEKLGNFSYIVARALKFSISTSL